MQTQRSLETPAHVLGVPGRMTIRARDAQCFTHQKFKSQSRPIKGYGKGALMSAEIRFDDNCKNGQNSFAITATVYIPGRRDIEACDCMHDEIEQVFPEFAPLIRWHLFDTRGPMHYPANALYHAGDRDCNGLLKGERRQIRNGRTGLPCWTLAPDVEKPAQYVDSENCPTASVTLRYVPLERVGEGKARDLDAARNCAAWPDATDEQLCAPKDELRAMLEARLPALLIEFRAAIEGAGFAWEPVPVEA